ncbi:hypothetical protein RFI_26330 [Reticulomyxa filosa]|uniref:Uncharacterized protein n=1 Tax=Reticulomyxa filosa TaxID=46433 RepID=X6MAL0_RETFI|nr:hypothetical protein RFI_26330 [Reticulomyxa filosa]|eukprot:ETO11048.1 hypothetical protein RFI_26330 [Reticulomyxa filosa]
MCLLVAAETFFCAFSFYHLCKLKNGNSSLQITCVCYHAILWLILCLQFLFYIGEGKAWWLHNIQDCQVLIFVITTVMMLIYLGGAFFWLRRLGLLFFVFVPTSDHEFTFTCRGGGMGHLVIVFEGSFLGITKCRLWGLYLLFVVVTLFVVTSNVWTAIEADCVWYYKSSDFDILASPSNEVNGKKVYWTCRLSILSFTIGTVIGMIILCIVNITIGYMYVTRIIYTVRAVHKNQELNLVRVGGNSSGHGISQDTMQMLMHVRKCGLIALTSITSSLISFAIVWSTGAILPIFIDCVFNGIWILCSFTFGKYFYNFCFGCCMQQSELLLSRLIRDT